MGLSIVEQRYQDVMAVLAGDPVTELTARVGVSRESLHAWLRRYAEQELPGAQDRHHGPDGCAHQASPLLEGLVWEMRRLPGRAPERASDMARTPRQARRLSPRAA